MLVDMPVQMRPKEKLLGWKIKIFGNIWEC